MTCPVTADGAHVPSAIVEEVWTRGARDWRHVGTRTACDKCGATLSEVSPDTTLLVRLVDAFAKL